MTVRRLRGRWATFHYPHGCTQGDERSWVVAGGTTRPESGMTVSAALALDVFQLGAPEVVAGAKHLDNGIRWAHAGEVPNIADLLRGGELLLTTGMGLKNDGKAQRRLVVDLVERGVAALAVELGQVFSQPPGPLVRTAVEHDLPLVILHREVPFIELTEAINKGLLGRQLSYVRRADELQRQFTGLMLDGAGIPEVLGALATAIGSPVILEKEGGELLFHAAHIHDSSEVLSAWDSVRRTLPGAPESIRVDMPGGRIEPHAHLIALGLGGTLAPITRLALERAADLLAIVMLQSRQEEILIARERGNLLARLLETDLSEPEISRQVEAMGFPRRVPYLLPCVLAATGPGRVPRASAAALWSSVWRYVKRELDGRTTPILGGLMPSGHEIGLVVGLASTKQREPQADHLADLFRAALKREVGSETAGLLFVGDAARSWTRAVHSLREVADAARTPRVVAQGWYDATRPDLMRLLWVLRDSPDMHAFVVRRLGPLIEHDRTRSAMLIPTLEAFLECAGNKTQTARFLHLERQSLYHRLSRIEDLIGESLGAEDTRLGLHLALRARRLMPGVEQDVT